MGQITGMEGSYCRSSHSRRARTREHSLKLEVLDVFRVTVPTLYVVH